MTSSEDKTQIDGVIDQFFTVFNNTKGPQVDFSVLHRICIPEAIIIRKTGFTQSVYDLKGFIAPRKIILSDGTLTDFQESEVRENTLIDGHIAQRCSQYEKTGYLNGSYFHDQGTKMFQLIKTE